jgi:hypothetical protein
MQTVIYLVFAFIIILISWVLYQRQTFKGFVTGAVLCTFITASGASYDKVLPVEGKWVLPPKGKWLKKKDSKQKWGKYILPTDTYTTSYPLAGWPEFMRVEVRRAFYYEDCPTPIVPEIEVVEVDEEGKKVKKYVKAHGVMQNITPKVLATLTNPEIAKVLLNPSGDTVQDITNPQKKSNNKMMILLILVAIGVVVSLAGAFLTYMVYSAQSGHISYWGG